MVLDGVLTLVGQSESYWSNFRLANEASPAYFFMAVSPGLYVIGALVWFVGLWFLFKKLGQPCNLMLAMTFLVGNTWGSSTWIMKLIRESSWYAINDRSAILLAWVILASYFTVVSVNASFWLKKYFERLT